MMQGMFFHVIYVIDSFEVLYVSFINACHAGFFGSFHWI